MSRARERIFGAVALGVSLLLVLVVFELGFRLKAYYDDREVDAFGRVGLEPLVDDPNTRVKTANIIRLSPDPGIIYELIPGVHANYKRAIIRINADGFRGRSLEEPVHPPAVRIFGLGDSVMFGYGVGEGEYYLHFVEQRLQREQPSIDWVVINTGVPGYNTAMEVETLEVKLLSHHPDLVVIHYVDNDRALPNFIRNRAPYFTLTKSYLWKYIFSLKRGWERPPDDRLAEPESRDPDAVPAAYAHMIGTEGYRRAMARLAELRDAHGFRAIVMSTLHLPPEIAAIATELGFPIVDGYAAAAAHLQAQGLTIDDYTRSDLVLSKRDPHPSPVGHRILADVLYDTLKSSGMRAALEAKARSELAKAD